MSLANKLNYLMLLSGISQIELATNTKIERSTLTKILNGTTTQPKLETIDILAKYFNMNVTELIGSLHNLDDNDISKNYQSLKNNLQVLMEINNIKTTSILSKYSGVPTYVLNDILIGNTTKPKIKTLQLLSNYFNISIPQLLGIDLLTSPNDLLPEATNQLSIPMLSLTQIPAWILDEIKDIANITKVTIMLDVVSKKLYATKISDNHFSPDFMVNNILIIDPEIFPIVGDMLVCELNKRTISIYEILNFNNEVYVLREAGTKMKIEIPKQDIKLMGTIIQHIINRE